MLVIILIILGSVIALVLLAAAFMKKKYSLVSNVVINRPAAEVADFVRHLRNQENYSKWVIADPNVKLTYTGTDGTVGFIARWESEDKNVGVGEQEITRIIDGEGYDVELRFEKPFKGTNYANTRVKVINENSCSVTVTFDATTPFPMNIMVPMLSKMLLKDMETNGTNLKKLLEAK